MSGCRNIAAELRDELLNGEVFYSLKEAQIVIEQWRKHYNTIRPLSLPKTRFVRIGDAIRPKIA